MNRGGLSARYLNIELQRLLNGLSEPKVTRYRSIYAPSEKVIQRINDYDKEVFNGDIGVISAIDLEKGLLQITFEERIVVYEFIVTRIKSALVLIIFMLIPIIPITGTIGLFILIFRPIWFKKLVDNVYADKNDR